MQALAVADDESARFGPELKLDAPGCGARHELLGGRRQERREIERGLIDLDLPGDDARDVHDVVDEPRLESNTPLDGLERPCPLRPVELPALQEAQPPEDTLER